MIGVQLKVSLRIIFLYGVLFFVYTQGMWERIIGNNMIPKTILEVTLFCFILSQITFRLKRTPGLVLFLIFACVSFIILFFNGSTIASWIKYIRYLIYFYLLYYFLYNTYISHDQWKSLFKFIIFLILFQGIGSLYTLIILGIRVEGYIGTMSSLGGTTGAVFPLFISTLCLLLYYYHYRQNHSKQTLLLLICFFSVALVAYQSMKRAIYFSLPAFILIVSLLAFNYFHLKKLLWKRLLRVGVMLITLIPVYVFGILSTGGISSNLSGNESKAEIIKNAFSYAKKYSFDISEDGLTMGQLGTSLYVLKNSYESSDKFLFGEGYGKVKDERILDQRGIMYGIVGFSSDLISAGWIYMILVILFMTRIILNGNSLQYGIIKNIRVILLLLFIYVHLTYSTDYTYHLKINAIMAVILAFVNSPLHTNALDHFMQKYYYTE